MNLTPPFDYLASQILTSLDQDVIYVPLKAHSEDFSEMIQEVISGKLGYKVAGRQERKDPMSGLSLQITMHLRGSDTLGSLGIPQNKTEN